MKILVKKTADRSKANPADLAAEYKYHGFNKHYAWDMFIKDRDLSPEIDAKEFYAIYENVPARPIDGCEEVEFEPTHTDTYTDMPCLVTVDEHGVRNVVWANGMSGSHPPCDDKFDKRYVKIGETRHTFGVKAEKDSHYMGDPFAPEDQDEIAAKQAEIWPDEIGLNFTAEEIRKILDILNAMETLVDVLDTPPLSSPLPAHLAGDLEVTIPLGIANLEIPGMEESDLLECSLSLVVQPGHVYGYFETGFLQVTTSMLTESDFCGALADLTPPIDLSKLGAEWPQDKKGLKVGDLRNIIETLGKFHKNITATQSAMLLGTPDAGRYGDLSVAAAAIGLAEETLDFQRRMFVENDHEDDEYIADM